MATEAAETTRSSSTRSTTFVNCAMYCDRFGSEMGVLWIFAATKRIAQEVASPTFVTALLESARARSLSGVRRENRGSRDGGDQTFSVRAGEPIRGIQRTSGGENDEDIPEPQRSKDSVPR